ncbi:MAG: hypothetical protein IIA06_10135 [Proteobacteria bacterium]|nr:hypothetical protein [Pseudomonadota bacterium]
MEITENQLQERYSSLPTDELVDLLKQGNLSEMAEPILIKELSVRGLDINKIINVTTKRETRTDNSKKVNIIIRLWKGDVKLVITFWVFWWLVGFAVLICSILIELSIGIPNLSTVLSTIYTIFMMVALWRSASKYTGHLIWRNAAQLWVVLAGLSLIIILIKDVVSK